MIRSLCALRISIRVSQIALLKSECSYFVISVRPCEFLAALSTVETCIVMVQGPDLHIHHSDEVLANMNEWSEVRYIVPKLLPCPPLCYRICF